MMRAPPLPPPHPKLKFNQAALHLLECFPRPHSPSTFKQIHSQFLTTGLSSHTYPFSRLLAHSWPLLPLSYSLSLLHSFPTSSPSPFLFNTLISSLCKHRRLLPALSLYLRLLPHPNPHTFPPLLKACAPHPPYPLLLHAHILQTRAHRDPFVLSSLLSFYSARRDLAACHHLFRHIPRPDLPLWNSLLSAAAASSSPLDALPLFRTMLASQPATAPNETTLVPVIVACGHAGALAEAAWAHCYALRNDGLRVNRFVATALVETYSRCGRLDLAEGVFAGGDTMSYNAMIRAYGTHGRGSSAVGLFDRMAAGGVRVDEVTLVAVMSACAHAGLVGRGRNIFDSMEGRFGIVPRDEHYGCLVDLLGRAGRLEEAERVVREMPAAPSAVVYRSLLGACRRHNDSERGERMVADLLRLEPEHGGNYVLQSNMYADANRWNDVGRVRKAMKEKGIDKTPGSSLVELDGALHEFIMGDKTHPCSKEIYAMIDEMGRRLHGAGYRPKTKGVMFDMEEEDKEDVLSYHSERLAIAFALVASDSSVPIKIVKNLRVCADCHSTIKLISSIYQREIIMRDRSRFHHFKNGACSCSDYW